MPKLRLKETDEPNAAVVVRCLGTFSLTVHGQPVERWRAGKTRNLFHYLLMNRGQVVLKTRLQEVLWPEHDGSSSTSLRVAVHALRRILDSPLGDPTAPVQVAYQDMGYMLSMDDVWVDVEQFAAACAEGHAAESHGDRRAAVEAYHRAVGLYTGDFLAQDEADWAQEYRQWNRTRVLQALSFLRNEAIRRGDVSEAAQWSQATLEIDQYHENSYRTLMSVHASRGERGQVKLWYELCARRLEELSVDPEPTTSAIYARALGGPRPRPAARPVTTAVRAGRPACEQLWDRPRTGGEATIA